MLLYERRRSKRPLFGFHSHQLGARNGECLKKLSNAYNILAGLITIPKLISSCNEIEIYPLLSPFISLWIIFRWFKQKKKTEQLKKDRPWNWLYFFYLLYVLIQWSFFTLFSQHAAINAFYLQLNCTHWIKIGAISCWDRKKNCARKYDHKSIRECAKHLCRMIRKLLANRKLWFIHNSPEYKVSRI